MALCILHIEKDPSSVGGIFFLSSGIKQPYSYNLAFSPQSTTPHPTPDKSRRVSLRIFFISF